MQIHRLFSFFHTSPDSLGRFVTLPFFTFRTILSCIVTCTVNSDSNIKFYFLALASLNPTIRHFVKLRCWMFESPVNLWADIIYIFFGIRPFINIYIVRIFTCQIINITSWADSISNFGIDLFDCCFHIHYQCAYLCTTVCIDTFLILLVR